MRQDGESTQAVRARAMSVIGPLSVPAMMTRDGVCIAANAEYLRLVGIEESRVVGRSVLELLDERVVAADRRFVENAPALTDATGRGHLWCRVRDANGGARVDA